MKRAPTFPPLVAIDGRSARPLYRQLYEGCRDAILEGRVRPGQRLPSTRALAADLRISRLTVLTAFEQLVAEGYFESRVGAGTFVARTLPDALPASAPHSARDSAKGRVPRRRPRGPVLPERAPEPWLGGWGAFRVSQPAVERFPIAVWSRLIARHSRNPRARLLNYGDPMGHLPFREVIATYLRTARAVRCEADQVMVVSGSQQALAITARALLAPGDRVWVEEPGYRGARDVLALAGARLAPVPVDDEGLDVAAGAAACAGARAAYVTPSHQYPLGVTLSASRRFQLLDWARRRDAWLIEDDYDSEYRYDSLPIAALQGLDRDGRVIYIGTFSKVLFPALRLGYLVIPSDLVPRFVQVREAMDIFPASLPQAALADFINEGEFGRHLRRMRALYGERRAALAEAVDRDLGRELTVIGDAAGMHLAATGPARWRDHAVALQAARRGLWAMPLSSCYLGKPTRRGLVLGYGGTTVVEIRAGVHRLRRLLAFSDDARKYTAALLVAATLAALGCSPASDRAPVEPPRAISSPSPVAAPRKLTPFARHRGMSYAYGFLPNDGGGYGSPTSARSLARLRELGVDWVSITPFGFLSGPTDTSITWKRKGIAETDASLKQAADDAHALGMRVMLKPHIWLRPPEWAGSVGQTTAEGWRSWFESYARFILHYARVASAIGADALCVGTELEKTTGHTEEWTRMIASVRAVYGGPLTYASNPQEVHAVGFWDRLDFIGVNGYYPLVPNRTPTVEELVAAWSTESRRLAALSERLGKPVVFTELGYRSADFAGWKHWEIPGDAPVNLVAQANAYEAFYRAIWPEPWCGGVYWWKWFSFPDHSSPTSNDFEPENKPAEAVIARHYTARDP